MGHITDNLYQVHQELASLINQAGRTKESVKLLCVSKTKPQEAIIEAYNCGERLFGESYVNEAVTKIQALKALGYTDLKWHFIGPLQSNKTKAVAENFDMVESVDRIKVMQRLNLQRPASLGPLEILIEVNISHEAQKSGCSLEELESLIDYCKQCPNLRLRGLMGIATDTQDKALIKEEFSTLAALFAKYAQEFEHFDILSMGMTHDMAEAILLGSTEVRIGTAIFGPREYKNKE